MKTLEQIIKDYKDNTLDGRQSYRFAQFLTFDKLAEFGFELKEGVTEEKYNKSVKPFTRENVLAQLEKDVAFGFEKALDQRGLSSSMMFECVKFWNNILEEGLEIGMMIIMLCTDYHYSKPQLLNMAGIIQ